MADVAFRIGPILLTNAAVTVRTVTAVTYHVTTISVTNTSGTNATLFLSIGADAAGTRLFSGRVVKSNDTFQWTGFVPVFDTQIIQAYSGTNNVLTLTVGGVDVS